MTIRSGHYRIYLMTGVLFLMSQYGYSSAWGMTFGGTVFSDIPDPTAPGVFGVAVVAKGATSTWETETDTDGQWAFADMPSDVYQVYFSKEGYNFYIYLGHRHPS